MMMWLHTGSNAEKMHQMSRWYVDKTMVPCRRWYPGDLKQHWHKQSWRSLRRRENEKSRIASRQQLADGVVGIAEKQRARVFSILSQMVTAPPRLCVSQEKAISNISETHFGKRARISSFRLLSKLISSFSSFRLYSKFEILRAYARKYLK